MDDPNATYKQAFRALTDKLGRLPTSRDTEWLALQIAYSRACGPASEATGAPAVIQTGSGDRTTGGAGNGPGTDLQSAMVEPPPEYDTEGDHPELPPAPWQRGTAAGRGPNGGVLATCEGCGKVWERERRRGRPSAMCGECR